MARPHSAVSPGGHSVTAAPTAQRHTKRAQAAVLPAVVVLLLFVHDTAKKQTSLVVYGTLSTSQKARGPNTR